MNAARQLDPPPFTVFPAPVIPVGGDPSPDDGPVALKVLPSPETAPVLGTKLVPATNRETGEGAPPAKEPAGANPVVAIFPGEKRGHAHANGHPRKNERSHAHDHWHYAQVPKSHLPCDVSDRWWRETKAMIDRGYDRFVARRHLDRHSPEWSISNWGVCAGVRLDEKP